MQTSCLVESPLISIIIPVYNVELYIRECIKSAIAQTYKNMEIIIVDDGSTDRSGLICEGIKKEDDRIIVIHQKNKGLSCARNTGLERATGDYIVFLDGDDWLSPVAIEEMVKKAVENSADIVCADYYYHYHEKIELANSISLHGIINKDEAVLRILFGDIQTFVWGKLYRREVIGNHRFPNGKIFEDHFWTHEVFFDAENVFLTKHPLLYYRQRNDSISFSPSIERLDIMEGWKNRISFVETHYPSKLEEYRIKIAKDFVGLCWNMIRHYGGKRLLQIKKLRDFERMNDLASVNDKICKKKIQLFDKSVITFAFFEGIERLQKAFRG